MPEKEKNEKKNTEKNQDEKFSESKTLENQIKETSEGLFYMSETDAEILPFVGEKVSEITFGQILNQDKYGTDIKIEERDFEEFFKRLTEEQYWFEEEEREDARRFRQLKKLLEDNLRDLKVLRIGEIEIDIYVIGLNKEGRLMGIKTQAVET